jgi:hypothetical protein
LDGDEVVDISNEELTRLALAADPDIALPPDAISIWEVFGRAEEALLPPWYMPGSARRPVRGRRWKRLVVVALIIAFLAIDAYGLCSTYGSITIA